MAKYDKILKAFRKVVDQMGSGQYDLKKVASQEAGLMEQVKDALNRGQSQWVRDSMRGENYLKEMLRQSEMGMRDEMNQIAQPVLAEEAARMAAIGRMVDDAVGPTGQEFAQFALRKDRDNLVGGIRSSYDRLRPAVRMQFDTEMSRAGIRNLDEVQDVNVLRQVLAYLDKLNKGM